MLCAFLISADHPMLLLYITEFYIFDPDRCDLLTVYFNYVLSFLFSTIPLCSFFDTVSVIIKIKLCKSVSVSLVIKEIKSFGYKNNKIKLQKKKALINYDGVSAFSQIRHHLRFYVLFIKGNN
jgi:hypothetical protein